ncbi:MAG: tetraacyldisaccharide 4'-kinase, partial [bacterium]
MIHDMRRGAKLFSIVSGERSGAGAALTRLGLRGLSAIYYAAFRRRTGKLSRIEKTRVSAPVISVGNITLGGTGKTPICLYLATHYAARGLRVGIATRGYGREGGGTVILKEAGNARSWHVCGDEPMLFLNDPSVYAVAVDADRSRAAGVLAGPEGCDVVILDDGFQFITLERDVDIAVLDAGNPFGHDALFPAGLLREPVAALARADVIWIAKAETVSDDALAGIRERLTREFPGKPVIESRHEPSGVVA